MLTITKIKFKVYSCYVILPLVIIAIATINQNYLLYYCNIVITGDQHSTIPQLNMDIKFY